MTPVGLHRYSGPIDNVLIFGRTILASGTKNT